MMKERELTKKEKIVMYGLVKHPEKNSKELATILNLSTTTVNTIKNRLKNKGLITKHYLPNPEGMTFKKLKINYDTGEFNKIIILDPEIIYSLATSKQLLTMKINRSEDNEKSLIEYDSSTLIINKFFDYETIISELFKITDNTKKDRRIKRKTITDNEKKVMRIMNNYPEIKIQELSEMTKLSLPTVCRIRRELLNNNILIPKNIPNIEKLGFEVLTLKTHDHKPSDEEKNFVSLYSNGEYLTLTPYKNYSEAIEDSECEICEKERKQITIPLKNTKEHRVLFNQISQRL